MEEQKISKNYQKIIIIISIVSIIFVIIASLLIYYFVISDDINQENADNGIKITFIDKETDKKIKNQDFTFEIMHKVQCDQLPCENSSVCYEGKTNKDGVAYLDVNKWFDNIDTCPVEVKNKLLVLGKNLSTNKDINSGLIKTNNWLCPSLVTTFKNEDYLYVNTDTNELLLECEPK